MSKLYFLLRWSSFGSSFSPVDWKDASVSAVSFLANSFSIYLGELFFLSLLLRIGLMLLLDLSCIIIIKIRWEVLNSLLISIIFPIQLCIQDQLSFESIFDEKDCEVIFQNHNSKTNYFLITRYSFSASFKCNVHFIDVTWLIVLQLLKFGTKPIEGERKFINVDCFWDCFSILLVGELCLTF